MSAQTETEPRYAYCTGYPGKTPCMRRADVFVIPPRGNCVQDALAMCEVWLKWYESLPWWRRIWV